MKRKHQEAKAVSLRVALRAFIERHDSTGFGQGSRFSHWNGWPADVLVLDTETTTDATQRLLYGFWRGARWTGNGTLETIYEGIMYANDLATRDPQGFARLKAFANREAADVAPGHESRLYLLTRDEFMRDVFWPVLRRVHGVVVGFNLPFDLTRLALGAGAARRSQGGSTHFRGGFSLRMSEYVDPITGERKEDRYDPRLWIKHIEQKRAFMQLATPAQLSDGEAVIERDESGRPIRKSVPPGHFLDLSTLAFALTNEKYSLAGAAKAFGTAHQKSETEDLGRITEDAIRYARQDVLVTAELLEKLRIEFDRHPVTLDPCKAYSPAGLGKAYVAAMGVAPPGKVFASIPSELHGIAMNAYYGGRAEGHVRRTIVPVMHTDFLSMYPTVNARLKMWDLFTAESLVLEDATDEVRQLLDEITLDRCFDPAIWPRFRFFAEIIPDEDIVPIRAQYEPNRQGFNIGVNRLARNETTSFWYAGPDLVASVLLAGKPPRIKRAYRLVPVGKQATLTPVNFGGELTIDPARDDFFKRVIELRKTADRTLPANEAKRINKFLKILANSTGYGVFAEMNREELAADETVDVAVYGRRGAFDTKTTAPENPGLYAFPPFASLTTSGARLMLALLERCVTDLGGTYAFCDTDSMAIVATKDGGPIAALDGYRALSYSEVEEIVRRFEWLNPYDRDAVPGSVLEVEDVNRGEDGEYRELFAYVISAKRYAFFTRPTPQTVNIVEASEHGLGHVIDPLGTRRDDKKHTPQWIADAWEMMIREELGLPTAEPEYFGLPAIARIGITTPRLLEPFARLNEGQPYDDQIKPSNFLVSATVDHYGHAAGVVAARYGHFHLVHPHSKEFSRLLEDPWTDLYSGEEYFITTAYPGDPAHVRVKTYRALFQDYRTHIEAKSAGPDGQPCTRSTHGVLQRLRVEIGEVVYIGKEANRLEDVQNGTVHELTDVLNIYVDPADDPWVLEILPQLARFPTRRLANALGISERRVRMLRAGDGRPSRAVWLRAVTLLRMPTLPPHP